MSMDPFLQMELPCRILTYDRSANTDESLQLMYICLLVMFLNTVAHHENPKQCNKEDAIGDDHSFFVARDFNRLDFLPERLPCSGGPGLGQLDG